MAYWCKQHISIDLVGPEGASSVRLDRPYARVGAHAGSDVVLPPSDIAGRGLYFHATNYGVFCLDLRRAESPLAARGRWLKPTDEVEVGNYVLRARADSSRAVSPVNEMGLDAAGSAHHPLPVLKVFHGDRCLGKRRLSATLNIVGRWAQCGLQLQGRRVSGIHCALFWDSSRLWCVDLVSSNQTLHRDQPIHCVEMALGDRIEVGEFGVVFQRLSRRRSAASPPSVCFDRQAESPAVGLLLPAAVAAECHAAVSGRDIIAGGDSLCTIDGEFSVVPDPSNDIAAVAERVPNLQQLERWSLTLQGQLEQIRSEANQLAHQAEGLAIARLQWEADRAEFRELLGLQGRRPAEPASDNSSVPMLRYDSATIETVSVEAFRPLEFSSDNSTPAKPTLVACSQELRLPQSISLAKPGTATVLRLAKKVAGVFTGKGRSIDGAFAFAQPLGHDCTSQALQPAFSAVSTAMNSTQDLCASAAELHEPTTEEGDGQAAMPSTTCVATAVEALPMNSSLDTAAEHHPVESAPVSSDVSESPRGTDGAAPVEPKRVTPIGRSSRRTSIHRDQLVDFVSDRMVKLERQRKRKKLFVGMTAATSLLVLLAVASGLWYSFGQEYLPVPEAVAQQIPESVAVWFQPVVTADR